MSSIDLRWSGNGQDFTKAINYSAYKHQPITMLVCRNTRRPRCTRKQLNPYKSEENKELKVRCRPCLYISRWSAL